MTAAATTAVTAKCTAPRKGHESASAAEACPRCGGAAKTRAAKESSSAKKARVASPTPQDSTWLRRVQTGDLVLVLSARGKTMRARRERVSSANETSIWVDEVEFSRDTAEKIGDPRTYLASPDDKAAARLVSGTGVQRALRIATKSVAAVLRSHQDTVEVFNAEDFASLDRAVETIRSAVWHDAMAREDSLGPRQVGIGGLPHAYTDQDVHDVLPTIVRAARRAARIISANGDDEGARSLRRISTPLSVGEFRDLLEAVEVRVRRAEEHHAPVQHEALSMFYATLQSVHCRLQGIAPS